MLLLFIPVNTFYLLIDFDAVFLLHSPASETQEEFYYLGILLCRNKWWQSHWLSQVNINIIALPRKIFHKCVGVFPHCAVHVMLAVWGGISPLGQQCGFQGISVFTYLSGKLQAGPFGIHKCIYLEYRCSFCAYSSHFLCFSTIYLHLPCYLFLETEPRKIYIVQLAEVVYGCTWSC